MHTHQDHRHGKAFVARKRSDLILRASAAKHSCTHTGFVCKRTQSINQSINQRMHEQDH
jgi:hypothetical protein